MSELNLRNPRGAVNSAAEAAGRTLRRLRPGRRDDTQGETTYHDYPRETRQTTEYADDHTQLIRQPTAVSLPHQPASAAAQQPYEPRISAASRTAGWPYRLRVEVEAGLATRLKRLGSAV